MIIYLLSILWVMFLEMTIKRRDVVLIDGVEERHVGRIHAFVAAFFLIFFIGLRSAGSDTAAYIKMFHELPTGMSSVMGALREKEGLFRAFGVIMKTWVSDRYEPYLFVIALVSGWSVANTIRKNSPYFTSAMVLFVLSGMYIWMINGIRQFLAASLAFAAVHCILRRRPVKYLIIVLLLSGVHTSALLLIPIYFLVTGKAFSRKTLLMLAVAVFAILFTTQFTDVLESSLENTSYGGVTEGELWQADDGSNILRTCVYAVPVILSWIERKKIQDSAPAVIHLCVNMSIICVAISMIANVTSGIYIGRLTVFFSLYNLILLPWLANHSTFLREPRLLNLAMHAAYLLLFFLDGRTYYASDLLHLYFR